MIKPTTKKPGRANAGKTPLPADVEDEIGNGGGPCDVGSHYGVVQTNQLGEIQVHPCVCARAFLYSEQYGWLYISKGSPLRDRVTEVIKEGIEAGVFRSDVRL